MPSAHPRLNTLPADLFAGLQSFRELEERISALPDGGLQRGDALEVFVEAHLQTSPLFQVEELWLVNQIPLSVRRQLKLPSDSKGIDGVYRMSDGTLAPYQVKFRKGRPQVGVGDTASFFMLTESAPQRILISNCDRYAKEIRDRKDLRIYGGLYFDELTAEDFTRIHSWLRNKPVIPRRERPLRPHQARAVKAIVSRLRSDARATAVMPCGTGKTLVGLRVVEELKPRNVVVFVPSLALLAQLLEDWAKDTTWGKRFRYLCVCSQPAVSAEVDRWELNPTDVHFPVNTDPAVVHDFLKHDDGEDIVRVVFSTYQSARKVADGLPRGFRFDVGLFDEAHKTTEGGFGLALEDRNLPIDRRLFLTATPRHIDIKHRDKQGDFKVVSMDNPEVYGQPAFSQSFPEAVEEGIICDYRVVVATVDRSEVSEYAERCGITLVKGDANATRWVASQIAVTRAIEETGASKLITFHSRVQQAKDFASDTSRGIGQFLPAFRIGHVNGTQPVTDRKDVLSGFRGNGKMLVTNARCLTEGVDLPAVDAVVFNNPRRSRVDIVQAVGRAMRKPPHSTKQLGYVVLPILLEHNQTDDLEEACRGTEWEDLVAVLAALRDHDSRLDEMIREAQEAAGRGEVFDPRPFGERINIISRPQVALNIIQQSVGAVILERLGQTWDLRFGQLETYKKTHGDCDVPKRGAHLQLGHWVVMQRQLHKKGVLKPTRFARLNALGFTWDTLGALWESRFEALTRFRAIHGHCSVPKTTDVQLATWVVAQRQLNKSGQLSEKRAAKLTALGFIWDEVEAAWHAKYDALKRFHAIHGHCGIPLATDKGLADWIVKQRQDKKKKRARLSAAKISLLDELNFVWAPFLEQWNERYAQLEDYHAKHGSCRLPSDYHDKGLIQWASSQRTARKKGRLSGEQIKRLDRIEFEWNPFGGSFEELCNQLKKFKEATGHCNVPARSKEFSWVGAKLAKLKEYYRRRGNLDERGEILLAMGVVFDPFTEKFEERFARLAKHYALHGDCNIGNETGENSELLKWVAYIRGRKKQGKLSAEQVARLDSLGFLWSPKDAARSLWKQQIAELKAYIAANGDSNVPLVYPTNQEFADWWRNTRSSRNAGKLNKEKERELDALSVTWSLEEAKWNSMFEQLKLYKKQFGDCKVPHNYADNPKLGRWVGTQIYEWRKKITRRNTEERARRLASIGFWGDWSLS